ncbi:MAG: DUF2164 domain-containing protein [Candidatus Thermoplasmatota archaeon]
MPIKLSKETEKVLVASIKRFAKEELDLDIGDLKAGFILDFALREVGPTVYNQAIDDAARFMAEKVEDLPGRHEKEFGYWKR